MHGSYYGEHQQCSRCYISREADKEKEEANHQHLLPVEGIHDEAAERTNQKGSDDVAGKENTDGILIGAKHFRQIQREQRCKQIESKEQREIRCHHPDIIPIP